MTDIGLGNAQPTITAPPEPAEAPTVVIPTDFTGVPVPPQPPKSERPANPYAPTGWRKKQRVEFDLELPSGQMCRVMRLERDDLLRMNLMEYLDTFTPMLLDNTQSDAQREKEMTETLQKNPAAMSKMFAAVDKVVMSATIRPRITEDPEKVDYGTEKDWANPNFIATVLLEDIDTFERMYIFSAAFGKSMEDLKSLWEQEESVGPVADVPGVQQDAE